MARGYALPRRVSVQSRCWWSLVFFCCPSEYRTPSGANATFALRPISGIAAAGAAVVCTVIRPLAASRRGGQSRPRAGTRTQGWTRVEARRAGRIAPARVGSARPVPAGMDGACVMMLRSDVV